MLRLLIATTLIAVACAAWTGKVQDDFNFNDILTKKIDDLVNQKDVGLPIAVTQAGYVTSGYDIEYIAIRVDPTNDALDIGIKCWVICGDADGNGDPDGTSSQLAGLGGIDQPGFALSESALIAFDFGTKQGGQPDGGLDFIIGYPASEAVQSDPLPCNSQLLDKACFGLYRYYNPFSYSQAQYRFQWFNNDAALGATPTTHAVDRNPTTSAARPHLEWSIKNINQMLAAGGYPTIDYGGVRPFKFNFLAFQGSFEDDGIGEDFMPGTNGVINIEYPCRTFDACGVCGGNGASCADCAGTPNGQAKYDACDVCNGNGATCKDCKGIMNGPNKYDACDVCGGNGSTCKDCKGVMNGPAKYDACDVCGGNGATCLDCKGVMNGPAKYDACDVCGGDSSTCKDCAGMPNGAAKYDVCNICNGNGKSCLDCFGMPFGVAVYDDCGVCGGDGKSCRCDGALLTSTCNPPLTLVRSTCVINNADGAKLSQEVWVDPYDGARQIHYWHRMTEEYYGDASSVGTLSACPCACT